MAAERYFTNDGNLYLVEIGCDEFTNYEDICPNEAIYFGKKNNYYRNFNDDEKVNFLIDSFYRDKVFNSREELEETTKQMVEELHKKDIAILPFGKYEHSGVSLMPFSERCQDWRWDGTDLAGFAYMTKDTWKNELGVSSIEEAEKQLKTTLNIWNALTNGEVKEFTLYKVVLSGEKYDEWTMSSVGEDNVLCYNEDLGMQCGIVTDYNDYNEEKAINDFLRSSCEISVNSDVKVFESLADAKEEMKKLNKDKGGDFSKC